MFVRRTYSPQTAARRAARKKEQEDSKRSERRRMWVTIGIIFFGSVGLAVAEYFWMLHESKLRQDRMHPPIQRSATNSGQSHFHSDQIGNKMRTN